MSSPVAETAHLRCEACGRLALHAVQYAGRLVVSTQCGSCGSIVARDPAEARAEYLRDLEHRLQSKPARVLKRALSDPKAFLTTLPRKVAMQPTKLAREWRALLAASRTRGEKPPTTPGHH